MTPTNYDKHFKVLGKLCRIYDTGGPDTTAMQALVSTLYDQVATGTQASYNAVILLSQYAVGFAASIAKSGDGIKTDAVNAAKRYLIDALFLNDLTTVPANPSDVPAVLAALRTEMGAGGTWNTAADASADYKDSVYVVDAVVP
ncbi:MAG: hypothetical protein HY763_16885 [Planctomycetes bacterium]|nr:hypothetical protein [Planctomycetota bacterium]